MVIIFRDRVAISFIAHNTCHLGEKVVQNDVQEGEKKASLPVNQSTLLPISTGMNVIFSGTMGRTKSCLQWGEELMMI